MEPICEECGYDYRTLRSADAPSRLRAEAASFAETLRVEPTSSARPADLAWSRVEYAGHVRDMLLVARERVLMARVASGRAVTPMGRDERVRWGEYAGLTSTVAATEVEQSAEWLAHSWELLSEQDWARTVLYNYPEPAERTLAWVAAHIVHELVHHRGDVQRLT